VRVDTGVEMMAACRAVLPADAAIFAAAVGDWRIEHPAPGKLKKTAGPPAPHFVPNPDILATLSAPGPSRPRLCVGFAAETENIPGYAAAKLRDKGCDWIVANDVSLRTGVMGGDRNRVSIFDDAGQEDWPDLSKQEVAERLAARIATCLTS